MTSLPYKRVYTKLFSLHYKQVSLESAIVPFLFKLCILLSPGHNSSCGHSVAELSEWETERPQNELASAQCKYYDEVDK